MNELATANNASPERSADLAVITTVPGFITCAEVISQLRARYDGVSYDVSTATGMAKAIAARKELRDARIALDKKKTEVKRDALDFCAKVESDYKLIRAAVSEYEDIPDGAIKVEEDRKEAEKAEKARIAAEAQAVLDNKIAEIVKLPLRMVNQSSAEVSAFIAVLESKPIGGEFIGETRERAEKAKAEAIEAIRLTLAEIIRAEETAERLEAERVERETTEKQQREEMAGQQAELDEQKRVQDIEAARLKKVAEDDAAKLAEERAKFEEEKAEVAKKQAEDDRIAKEKQDAADEKKRDEDRQAAILSENNRLAAEKARNLAEAKFKDAATALQAIQDICADNRISDSDARAKIALIAEGNL